MRRNGRIEASTANHYARAVLEADVFLKGKAFNEVTALEWLSFHEWLKSREELGDGARYTRLQYLKATQKDRLETNDLPKRIKEALHMETPERPAAVEIPGQIDHGGETTEKVEENRECQ